METKALENRVYYGEYSLMHWLDLMLSGNIKLPEYQREFVWNEKEVKRLYKSLDENSFIPPVIIGSFNNNTINYILDGQQRLTSILLLALGIYPDKKKFKKEKLSLVKDDEDDESQEYEAISWKFDEQLITKPNLSLSSILAEINKSDDKKYKMLKDISLSDDFLKSKYLGFSYIVPDKNSDEKDQKKFYSTVFRNINILGVHLNTIESRQALYFLSDEFKNLFDPDFTNNFIVSKKGAKTKLDFVRYLSLITNYIKHDSDITKVGVSKSKLEDFYESYIYSVVNDEETDDFIKFTTLFPEAKFEERIKNLENAIEILKFSPSFDSIIEMDIAFFGLIKKIMFDNNTINSDTVEKILSDINLNSKNFKESQHQNPANISNLRIRINKSFEIYGVANESSK